MWRKNGPILSVEGKKGFFDIAYGSDSDAQKLDVYLPEGKGKFQQLLVFMVVGILPVISVKRICWNLC